MFSITKVGHGGFQHTTAQRKFLRCRQLDFLAGCGIFQPVLPFAISIDLLEERVSDLGVEIIAAPESRGFLFGVPLALRMEVGFVPIRKPGKLPRETCSIEYTLEYGSDEVEMHADAIQPGQKVLLVDDVLATGGTMGACCALVEKLGGVVIGCAFLMELLFLDGRKKIADAQVISLLKEAD